MGKCALRLIVDANSSFPALLSLWQLESGHCVSLFPSNYWDEKMESSVGIKEPGYWMFASGQEISEEGRVARLANNNTGWLGKLDLLRKKNGYFQVRSTEFYDKTFESIYLKFHF